MTERDPNDPVQPYPAQPEQFQPHPAQSYPQQPYPAQPGPMQPYVAGATGQPYGMGAPEHPQGTVVLVLGILGVFVAGICAPFAWYIGSKALREGAAAGVVYANQQSIVIGRILGIVMTILLLALILGLIIFGVVVLMYASSAGS